MFYRLRLAVTGEYYCKAIIGENPERDRELITELFFSKTPNWQGLQ
ncbi:hypothetical protein [Coleofasciculus sp.]